MNCTCFYTITPKKDEDDKVARAMAIRFEEKGGVYYNNDDKINNEKVAVADIAQYVAERTLSQYENEFEVSITHFGMAMLY